MTRFAPSPTGYLHLGHAFSALSAFDAAQMAKGRFIVRIEDIDPTRCRPDYEAAILEDLAWLGLIWEQPVRRQSDHMNDYAAALNRLIELGVMYRCFKTRKDVLATIANAPHEGEVAYRGASLSSELENAKLALGEAFAWRLSLERCKSVLGARWSQLVATINGFTTHIDPARSGDAVIARKEFLTSYHLACVVDDALQGITHVIRGQDLAEAPHLHVLLQTLLNLPTPIYSHHVLVHDESGVRLAKRNQAATLRALRDAGMRPDEVRARLGLNL